MEERLAGGREANEDHVGAVVPRGERSWTKGVDVPVRARPAATAQQGAVVTGDPWK